jgi:hypothetical protein
MRFPIDQMVTEWTGAFVHQSEYEPKHPQLEPKGPFDDPRPVLDASPDGGFGITVMALDVIRFTGSWTATQSFKMALFTTAPGISTTSYSTTNEASGTGYTAGGAALTSVAAASPSYGTTITADDASWASSTIEGVKGAMVYRTSDSAAVMNLDFEYEASSASGTFTVTFPAASKATKAL